MPFFLENVFYWLSWLLCWKNPRGSIQFIKFCRTFVSVFHLNRMHLPSDSTSYASEISRKRRFASSKLFGFLSGCHLSANFLYLCEKWTKQIEKALIKRSITKSVRRWHFLSWNFHDIQFKFTSSGFFRCKSITILNGWWSEIYLKRLQSFNNFNRLCERKNRLIWHILTDWMW